VQKTSPQQNIKKQTTATIKVLNLRLSGLKSKAVVRMLSIVENCVPNPNSSNIKKNTIDQI
jgi:hypothetical protein